LNHHQQSEGTQFIVIFILSIALMVTDHYTQLMLQFRSLLMTALTPVEQVAKAPVQIYQYLSQDFSTINQLKVKNNQLKTENLLLKTQLVTFNHLKFEIKQLNQLLNTASQLPKYKIRISNITTYEITPLSRLITIDGGKLQGFKIDQPVLNSKGVLGKIMLASLNDSKVLLITDIDSQIPIRIQRTGQRGILAGTGGRKLSLNFIPNTESVHVGDIIETSGLGNLYPPGLPVAKITQVGHIIDQPYYKITASPIANINTSSKVLVLKRLTTEVSL